ncbi:MAG: hypothetical protein FWF87_01965 [Synergistaceae bacterium]|nr:hypothetical protein [Synergistaceae bacterium]
MITRNKARVSVFVAIFALLALSASAFAHVHLVLNAPAGSDIGKEFSLSFYVGSGTTAPGASVYVDVLVSTDKQRVYSIGVPGGFNYRTAALSGSQHYAVTKQLYFTQEQVDAEANVEMEIQTGRRGDAYDSASPGTIPTDQILKGTLGTAGFPWLPAGGIQTPMFTKPGYGRFQFTKQEDLIELVENVAATCAKAHLFYLNDQIDPTTDAPFGLTLQFGYKIPIVIITNTPIPAGATFAEAAELVRKNGKPTYWHQGQIHGNEPSSGEGAMTMLLEMAGAYGDPLLEKINYVCVPRFNVEGGRNNARSSVNPSIDMNRDHMRLRAPEVRMVHAGYLAIMPHVTQDGHELGGYGSGTDAGSTTRAAGTTTGAGLTLSSAHDIESTPSTSMNNPLMDVVETALDLYGLNLFNNLKDNGILIGHYENNNHGWTANNSIGRAYYGLMGSVSFLTETRGQNAGLNMARRAFAQMSAAKSLVQTLYNNADATYALVAAARKNAVDMGLKFDETKLVYLNQSASGNTTNFRNTGAKVAGGKYSIYEGQASTLDWEGKSLDHVAGTAINISRPLAVNNTSDRNRVRPNAYVIPKGIEKTTTAGTTTVTAANGYAVNYEYLLKNMAWNGIEYFEINPGFEARVKQYYRSDTGNVTTSGTAGLRSEDIVVFEEGAYVVPLDQECGAVIVALFEPDISNANSYNSSVAQSLSGSEGLPLVYHDFTTRDYPYYRFEGDNPREYFKEKPGTCIPCLPEIPPCIEDKIEDFLDCMGCNAGFGLLALIFAIPFVWRKK